MIEERLEVAGRTAVVRLSDRDDGDLRCDGDPSVLARHRRRLAPTPWSWLRQVHGADLVEVTAPGEHAGATADAAATREAGVVLAVQHADCAPVVLVGPEGLAVAHAGWRGIVAGVLDAAVSAVTGPGGDARVRGLIGPCIRPHAYAFGGAELERVVAATDDSVVARTADGEQALDLARAVAVRLRRCGVHGLVDLGLDTASPRFFSHRVRQETGRQATVAWLVAAPDDQGGNNGETDPGEPR